MLSRILNVLFVCVLIGAFAGVAMADGKVYAGENCVVVSGSGAVIANSAIGNGSSTSWLYVDCPAINDSLDGASSGWVAVQDINNDSGGDVYCKLVSVYRVVGDGNTYAWQTAEQSSTGYGTPWQRLTFSSLSGSTSSTYYYACRIPPNDVGISWIAEYYLDE